MIPCPAGHDSATSDYCSVCGALMPPAGWLQPTSVPRVAPPGGEGVAPQGSGSADEERCPACGSARTGRFCEDCGRDFETGAPGAGVPPGGMEAAGRTGKAPAARNGTAVGAETGTEAGTADRRGGSEPVPPVPVPPARPPVRHLGEPALPSHPDVRRPLPSELVHGRQADAAQAPPQTEDRQDGARRTPGAPPPGDAVHPQPSGPGVSSGSRVVSGAAPDTPPTGAWTAVVAADRAYYDAMVEVGDADPNEVPFPPYCPERRFPLTGEQIRIGRHSAGRGFVPEIDLSRPPADPGVSHLHAVLLPRQDGSWVLIDPGSTNGTIVNGSPPIAINVEVPVRPGDRLHVGAWTVITLRKD